MAELVFHTGTMDCGKSTLALQLHHTHSSHGRAGPVLTSRDRAGSARISSRIGLSAAALEVEAAFDFWTHVIARLVAGHRIDYLVCDEVLCRPHHRRRVPAAKARATISPEPLPFGEA